MFSASEFSSAVDPYFVPAVPSDYTRGEGSIILERNDASYNAFGEACNALYSSLRYGDSELYYSSSYTWFSWFIEYTRNFGDFLAGKLNALAGSSGSTDLTNVESALSTIIDKMDNLPASVENTVVNITEDNDAFNIFYVTDEDGNEKSVTSVAGESLSASGKLLEFLYKLVVRGALDNVDDSITGLNDFFFDDSPSGLGEGVSIWD